MNLIPARLDAAGRAVVAGGWSPCPALAWHGAPGTAVTLGVRPAAVAAQPARPGAPAFAADLIEDVGPERHLHARADWAGGRLDLTLARPAGVALPAGAFAAAIPAAEAHLFDDETGLRLAPRGGALAATPDTPTSPTCTSAAMPIRTCTATPRPRCRPRWPRSPGSGPRPTLSWPRATLRMPATPTATAVLPR
jgi:hypothetical protein